MSMEVYPDWRISDVMGRVDGCVCIAFCGRSLDGSMSVHESGLVDGSEVWIVLSSTGMCGLSG